MRIKGLSKFSTPAPGVYDPLVCAILSSFSDCCASSERREEDKERSGKLFLRSAARPRQEGRSGSKCVQCGDSQAGVINLHSSDCSMSPIFKDWWPSFFVGATDEGREGICDSSAEHVWHAQAWSCQSQSTCLLPGWKVLLQVFLTQTFSSERKSYLTNWAWLPPCFILGSVFLEIRPPYQGPVPISQRK